MLTRWLRIAAIIATLLPSIGLTQSNPFSGWTDFQGENAGTTIFPFLKLPVGARALALGGHELTTGMDAAALCAFPAALGMMRDWRYSLSHAEVLGEFRHENLSLVLPLPLGGAMGLNSTALFSGVFEDARDIDENPVQTSATDMLLGVGLGRAFFKETLSLGAKVDVFRSGIGDNNAYGYAFSGAASFGMADVVQVSLMLNQLSHGTRYVGVDAPLEAQPMSWIVELGRPLSFHRIAWQFGFEHNNEGIGKGYGGLEWKVLNSLLLRGGYEASMQDRELSPISGVSFGFGFNWDLLNLDYGIKAMPPLGYNHALTLHYSRVSHWGNPDQRLLKRAREKYRLGKYSSALSSCRESVVLNPYNYQALALCQQIEKEIARASGQMLTLLFSANTNGFLAPKWEQGGSLGGLARRQSKVRELIGANPRTLLLDAGQLLRSTMLDSHADFLFSAYVKMNYDAVNWTAAGQGFTEKTNTKALPWVGIQNTSLSGVKEFKLGGNLRVLVYGSPQHILESTLYEKTFKDLIELDNKPGIRVLLLQGSLSDARSIAKRFKNLDAILLSGEPSTLFKPFQVGSTLIACPGVDGMYLGQLSFVLEKGNQRQSWNYRLIPLDASVEEDETMQQHLHPVITDMNLGWENLGVDDYSASSIVAIDYSKTQSNLILYDLESARIYPLEHAGLSATSPSIGYGRNQIAFVGEDSVGQREFYLIQPNRKIDTLTQWGGKAMRAHFVLKGQAMIALYQMPHESPQLFRLDLWSRESRNLTKNRYGAIGEFSVGPKNNSIAFFASTLDSNTLWVAALDASSSVAIASSFGFVGSPAWSPDGNRLAFLSKTFAEDASGVLQIFDFEEHRLIDLPLLVAAKTVFFTKNGKSVIVSSGVNVLDFQEVKLDVFTLRHVTGSVADTKNFKHPRLKRWGKREGILYESFQIQGKRGIGFLDLNSGEEIPLRGPQEFSLE